MGLFFSSFLILEEGILQLYNVFAFRALFNSWIGNLCFCLCFCGKKALKRICCRCGATYSVNQVGKHTRKEECNYHYGKGVEKKGERTLWYVLNVWIQIFNNLLLLYSSRWSGNTLQLLWRCGWVPWMPSLQGKKMTGALHLFSLRPF